MTLDRLVDLAVQLMLITFCGAVTILTPVWAWFIFRLYVPPKQKDAK